MPERQSSAPEALAEVALPVVIITGAAGDERGCSTGTVSYLSLEPPMVMMALAPTSATLALIRRSREFAVNVLSAGQADVAVKAAQRGHMQDKFSEMEIPDSDPPSGLSSPGIPGCPATIWCALEHESAHGDHVLCIGRIVEAEVRSGAEPLVRFRHRYHGLGESVEADGERPYPL